MKEVLIRFRGHVASPCLVRTGAMRTSSAEGSNRVRNALHLGEKAHGGGASIPSSALRKHALWSVGEERFVRNSDEAQGNGAGNLETVASNYLNLNTQKHYKYRS